MDLIKVRDSRRVLHVYKVADPSQDDAITMASRVLSATAPDGQSLTAEQVADLVAQTCPANEYRGRKILLIVPDATRTAPGGLVFPRVARADRRGGSPRST